MNRGLKIAMFAVLGVAAFILFGWVIQSLWNALLPELFGWRTITFWQAMGLFVLSKILLGGFTFRDRARRNGAWGMGYYWKRKWMNMSPEERERFKQKMRERCGFTIEDTPGSPTSADSNK